MQHGSEFQCKILDSAARDIQASGFAFIPGSELGHLLSRSAHVAWPAFAASWNDLGLDEYMADGGRYRRRKHATFSMTPDRIETNPQRPHYQSRESNTLNGGVDRWFDAVSLEISDGAVLTEIFGICRLLLGRLEARSALENLFVEMHQFRTEPSPLGNAKPTPEGMHRDGVSWVCIFLIDKLNIKYGTTKIANNNGLCVGRFNLDHTLDAVFIDDRRVKHYVTPIRRISSPSPGHRDVLVLTFDKR